MKLHLSPFLLLPTISTAVNANGDLAPTAAHTTTTTTTPTPVLNPRDITNANGEVLGASKSESGSKGSLDAPVDGKDGKPHAGLWVEGERRQTGQGKSSGGEKFDAGVSSLGYTGMRTGTEGEKEAATRSTEGEVSGKQNGKGTGEKVPEGPKEAPPLPYSEQQKMSTESVGKDDKGGSNSANLGKLTKPSHLPETSDNIRPPKYPSVKDDSLDHAGPKTGSSTDILGTEELPASNPLHSLVFSFTMIIVSEVGDKTFLVAALMAMRHPRVLVFSAAFAALIAMTVLSAVLGHGIPTLIPKTFTKFMAAVLFFVFGLKMLREGQEMDPDEGVGEEMKEVEMELEEKEQEQLRLGQRRSSVTPQSLEAGRLDGNRQSRSSKNRMPSPPESLSSSSSRETSPAPGRRWNDMLIGMNNLFSLLLSPAWVQTFAMTFLGEWGDRSQIATIAMAAGQDYWWVTVGAVTGHGICTAAAVIGGSAIAGKVSMRVVTLGGATAFLVFGVIYLIEALY